MIFMKISQKFVKSPLKLSLISQISAKSLWHIYIRCFNPFMLNGLFYLNSLGRSIFHIRGVWLVFIIIMFCRNELNANSVDPDQTPHSVASDLGLYCLPMSILWDARLKYMGL